MNIKAVIDPAWEEEAIVFTHKHAPSVGGAQRSVSRKPLESVGLYGSRNTILGHVKVPCFTLAEDENYACAGKERCHIRRRSYPIER